MSGEIETLTKLLARLPGLGPRSARRAVLFLLKRREQLMLPLAEAMHAAAKAMKACRECGNYATEDPCPICTDARRDKTVMCVVEEVGDVWAFERSGAYRGLYHVLGGTLSALDGRGPEDLTLDKLVERCRPKVGDEGSVTEVILALDATVDGQTTAHYVSDRLQPLGIKVTRLAQGVPVGGELDYLDDGTLTTALKSRREV
ncbi:MAG: recombination mediator RecR [Alphaproteobacteria bacterium]|nr:recombination mediator RecR [Alphaproteobacteria bacterium]